MLNFFSWTNQKNPLFAIYLGLVENGLAPEKILGLTMATKAQGDALWGPGLWLHLLKTTKKLVNVIKQL